MEKQPTDTENQEKENRELTGGLQGNRREEADWSKATASLRAGGETKQSRMKSSGCADASVRVYARQSDIV